MSMTDSFQARVREHGWRAFHDIGREIVDQGTAGSVLTDDERAALVTYLFEASAVGEPHTDTASVRLHPRESWPRVYHAWRAQHANDLAVREVLREVLRDQSPPPGAREELARLLEEHARKLPPVLLADMSGGGGGGDRDGLCEPDALLLEVLASLPFVWAPTVVAKLRADWTPKADERRTRWAGNDPVRAVRWLARVLWREEVEPRAEHARRKPPALAMCVHEPVAHLFSRVRREEDRGGQRNLLWPGELPIRIANTAASIGAETLDALMVDRGVRLFGTVASHRVLRWQIFTAHKQALEHNPDPRVLRVDGGWSTLAHDVLGMDAKKASEQVRDIIEAMHATEIPVPPSGSYSRLLIRTVLPSVGRRRGRIELVLGTALLPDYVHEVQSALGRTLAASRAQRLVPVLHLPPFAGRENEWGAQATLQMLLVSYMRDHAREMVELGGVALTPQVLDELARRAGLPKTTLPDVLDRWTHDGTDGAAVLVTTDRGRYTLADASARQFIEVGGRRELDASAGGKASARRRDAARRRARRGR